MIAQIDEQQLTVVALAMHPARKPDGFADIVEAQRSAAVGTIGVHQENRSVRAKIVEKTARRASMGQRFLSTREGAAKAPKTHAYSPPDYKVGRSQVSGRPARETPLHRRGHRVHAREYLLARPLPDPGRELRRGSGD